MSGALETGPASTRKRSVVEDAESPMGCVNSSSSDAVNSFERLFSEQVRLAAF